MTGTVLVDTGPLVALRDTTEAHHQACLDTLVGIRGPMVTCWPVLAEAAYLLRRSPAEVRGLLTHVTEPKFLRVAAIEAADIPQINSLLQRYESLGLQLADACLLHLADKLRIGSVFTLDRRDFLAATTASGRSLQLLPASL